MRLPDRREPSPAASTSSQLRRPAIGRSGLGSRAGKAAATALAILGAALVTAPAGLAAAAPACVPPVRNASAALANASVTVSPLPGSLDASYLTQISFLGVPASRLSVMSVTGSLSGAHPGRLRAYSQGDGASFLPGSPFRPGEVVTVRAQLGAGAAAVPLSWSFTVAEPVSGRTGGSSSSPPPSGGATFQRFVSRPDLTPPPVAVTKRSSAEPPGDLFVAPYSGPGRYGPMILDGGGQLVWYKPLAPGTRAADFRVQQLDGQPVLTWWQDPLIAGGSNASGIVIANSAYQDIGVARAGNGYQADLHEFRITSADTGLLTVYAAIRCNLSAVGGRPDGALADTIMQEIDLRTGLVMFEWHSVDHVPLRDSYTSPLPGDAAVPYDFFHINSIDPMHDGSYLVSARNTWAAYDLDRVTGRVRWALGGRHSSFAMGPGTRTAWQHDARELPDGDITFFDNGAAPRVHPQSRLIVLALDYARRTATLVSSFEHPTPLVAGSQGNFDELPDGDWVTGWGQVPYFSLFTASGSVLFDAHLPSSYEDYRAYWSPWSATPTTPPALAVRASPGGHGAIAYASWNGATGVSSWRVLAGSSPSALAPVATVARNGFETAIGLPTAAPAVEAQALGATGQVLATSPPAQG